MGNDIQDALKNLRAASAELFTLLEVSDTTDPQYAEMVKARTNNEAIFNGALLHLIADINRLWSPTTGTTPKETVPEPVILASPTPRRTSSAKPKEKPKSKRR